MISLSIPRLKVFNEVVSWVLLSKDPTTLSIIYTVTLFPSSPPKDLFTRLTVLWGKGHNQTCQELLDAASELTLIPGDPKYHHVPQ